MPVYIQTHLKDSSMLEIYSEEKNGKQILWGVVHVDILTDLGVHITETDLQNHEHQILVVSPIFKDIRHEKI